MKYLNLSNNLISNKGANSITSITNLILNYKSSLEVVDLSSNYIDSEQIQYIDKKKKLQHSKMVD
ncbi:MAG: hypothetical protein LF888_00215 [Candidatus Megaira endosymbiont of Mesostigma viride]|nr:MAG: hypothetical protein LF888_00215 [Candidatus Megaira endosymbiont of Mesostigma viride]